MHLFKTRTDLQDYLARCRDNRLSIGLVPTMGALHTGHLTLITAAGAECDIVVCSIFVNPTQFNDPADLENYPRTPEADLDRLRSVSCHAVFMPDAGELYQPGETWYLDLGGLDERLEGKFRPGHFQGVTQIVHKLFTLVQPDKAWFGQKDFQQFRVVVAMATRLELSVELRMHPIVREPSGLAMSSRNARLSATGKQQALVLFRVLNLAAAQFGAGRPAAVNANALAVLAAAPGVEPEYFELCDPETLLPVAEDAKTAVALVAAWVEGVRLIDNMILR